MKHSLPAIFLAVLISFLPLHETVAQFNEPPVKEKTAPRNLYDEGYKTGFGFNFTLSDFGFAGGVQFRKGLSAYTEAIVNLKVTGLKDPTEQTFIDPFFGFRTIPNKYKRSFGIPLYVGLKQRLFAEQISDEFRVITSLSAGPILAFSYPYFNDVTDNGFRENDLLVYGYTENVNDIFTGWDEMETHWGFGGEFVIGMDVGQNFGTLTTIQFGYSLNYFSKGIQVLEPKQPIFEDGFLVVDNNQIVTEPFNDPRKFFGSAQISFIFGWMW